MKSEESVEKNKEEYNSSCYVKFKCTNCKFKCMWKGKLACSDTASGEPVEIENEDEICSNYEQLCMTVEGKETDENKMSEVINTNRLINTFRDMANRGTLLARGGVTQEDLLIQIIGTIAKVAMNNQL